MFHLLFNFQTFVVWVFTDPAMKKLLVKFQSKKEDWLREGTFVTYNRIHVKLEKRGQDYWKAEMSQEQVGKLTELMTPIFMSPAYQLKSPRGRVAFLQAVNKLIGDGKMEVTKVKRDNQPTLYIARLFSKKGVAAITEFTDEPGKPQQDKLHTKNHKPSFLGEYSITFETYRKVAAFKPTTKTQNENRWYVHL